ncbi:nuclear transport factor 2 family protein [Chryseobacterium shandongense]|nr:nuclear transport factor 2 family protein [Chryseobacterium shandongense]
MTDNKSILLIANDYIRQGDNEGFLSFCTEDVTWEFVGDTILKGKPAVREYMQSTYAEPPEFDVQELIADDDRDTVVAIGIIKLINFNGSSKTYNYCDIWKLRNNKLAVLKAFVSEVGPL